MEKSSRGLKRLRNLYTEALQVVACATASALPQNSFENLES